MKFITYVFLIFLSFYSFAQDDSLKTKVLEPEAMQADFNYLVRLLKETHPGFYRYNSKELMQVKIDSSIALLHSQKDFYAFYSIVAGLISDVHCAHTYSLPFKDTEYFNRYMKTIPFFLFPIGGKTYVLFNLTEDRTVLPGFEVLAINGRRIDEIRKIMKRYYWADGHNEASKDAALQGQLFDIFYYSFIERPASFQLTFKTLNGDTIVHKTNAQTFSTAVKWLGKNPVNKQMNAWYNKKKEKHPWRLSFPKDVEATAILRFDGFGGKGMDTEEEARSAFRTFMDKSMLEISKAGSKNLVIDVRSNSGGWDNQGVELFTYLLKSDTAVKYYRRKHAITDNSEFLKFSDLSPEDLKNVKDELIPETDGTFTMKEEKSPTLQLQQAKPNRFKGQVYILMNERTYSTASEFTAAAKYYKVGVMVGQETPGAYDGGNGSSFIHLELPNSKIAIGTPLVSYQMEVGASLHDGRGTLPDHAVSYTIEDVLKYRDTQLEMVKKLIRQQ